MKAKRAFPAPGASTGSAVLAAAILAAGLVPAWAGAKATSGPAPDVSASAGPVDEAGDPDLQQLVQSSLEQLMDIKVATVSGAPQSRLATPAAVYVITGEEIRRSGHRSLVEALRLVPGMYVGSVNASSWIAGSRGLTGSTITATRYLVLVDGRLVYDPLTSTTFWDTVDTPLEDVDRIEVIRGPGATLWGANAMNGVINVLTKPASATVGDLVQFGGGTQDPFGLVLRHGQTAGPDAAWRIWAKLDRHGAFEGPGGGSLRDEWSSLRGGLRYDRDLDPATTLSVIGEAYMHPTARESVLVPVPGRDRESERITSDAEVHGASLLLRINRGYGTPEGWRLRAFVEQGERRNTRYGAERDTGELDLRLWRDWGARQHLMWGAGYLWTRDRTDPDARVLVFDEPDRAWGQANAFVQNTSDLVPERLWLMLGTKLTWHGLGGFGLQPSARLWWAPDRQQTLWAAVSRPVRMPSRFEEDGRLTLGYADVGVLLGGSPNGVIIPLQVTGDDALRPEKLLAWELGHRFQPGKRLLFETSVFLNEYDRLIEPAPTIIGAFSDAGSGRTWGAEFNATAQVTPDWRLEAGYSLLRVAVDGPVYQFEESSSPRHMAQLRSYLDLGPRWELDGALYHVDRIPQLGVPAYTRLDMGVTWYSGGSTRLSLRGQNLLDAGHAEASGAQVPRNVHLQVSVDLVR
jgi:iron complex outermembrane receptor protein